MLRSYAAMSSIRTLDYVKGEELPATYFKVIFICRAFSRVSVLTKSMAKISGGPVTICKRPL